MINTTIGKYKLIRLIGEGGMASVYEAEHELLGTKVAIKVLNPILSANAQIRERFINEAKLMASLDHPNITKVIDFDDQAQQLSIVMEFLNGEDLNDKINRNGPLPENQIADIFAQTLSAFQYAHEKGIVHRDIKPSNIFILQNGFVKILDFGIAKLFGQGNEMTQTGTQMGTPIYMSPEQVKGDKSIDFRSDIYSLGVTLFFAINGKAPYNSNTDSQFDIFTKIVHESLPDFTVNSKFNSVVFKACKKNREERYQSCDEFLKSFQYPESNFEQLKNIEEPKNLNQIIIENSINDLNQAIKEKENNNESIKQSKNNNKKKKLTLILSISTLVVLILFFCYQFLYSGDSKEENISTVYQTADTSDIESTVSQSNSNMSYDTTAAVTSVEKSNTDTKKSESEELLLGVRQFGTHFIEPYGTVEITKLNSKIRILGQQRKNDEYCTIDGYIDIIDNRNFSFTGKISLLHHTTDYDINTNQFPEVTENKVLNGTYLFRRIGGRRYWRLKQPDTPTGYFEYSYHYIDVFMD